jgi:hypothetical protein
VILAGETFNKEFKKSLREKILMKKFSNTLVVLVTTIPVLEAQLGMIYNTFLLPGKNDLCKA